MPPSPTEEQRLDVRSPDGTSIAVFARGSGRHALLLVHGSLSDHSTFAALIDALVVDVETFALNRRGYGASSDAVHYALEREFEDVAAVVEAVAARIGGPVSVFAHSYGANCAMGAAGLTRNVRRLILYEPSLGLPYTAGSIEAIEACLARGDVDAAVRAVLIGILGLAAADVDALEGTPRWPVYRACAHTVAREARVEQSFVYRRGQFGGIRAPTLLLTGSETPSAIRRTTEYAAEAIPNARVHVLSGHAHLAHKTDPALIATLIKQFIE